VAGTDRDYLLLQLQLALRLLPKLGRFLMKAGGRNYGRGPIEVMLKLQKIGCHNINLSPHPRHAEHPQSHRLAFQRG